MKLASKVCGKPAPTAKNQLYIVAMHLLTSHISHVSSQLHSFSISHIALTAVLYLVHIVII